MSAIPQPDQPEHVQKLNRDLRAAAKLMGVREARYYVNTYYDLQDYRIASANQQKKLLEGKEPNEAMQWLNTQLKVLEGQLHAMLDKWSGAQPMGVWARDICGIGPVFSAGLMAHIDISKAPTVGHIWRFAGLDPTMKWKKGEKRPWNASLWLMGESFVKVSGNRRDIYGKLYLERKEYEAKRNEEGYNRPECQRRLEEDDKKPKGKRMEADLRALLETGKLPQKALHERAKRWAVKLFLAHWFEEAYRQHHGAEPPAPYPIAHLGHAHRR